MPRAHPDLDFGPYEIDPESVRLLPQTFCLSHDVLILGKVDPNADTPVVVGISDPQSFDTLDSISRVMRGRRVLSVKVASEKIQHALTVAYGLAVVSDGDDALRQDPPQELEREIMLGDDTNIAAAETQQRGIEAVKLTPETDAPIKRMLNDLLIDALRRGATDIHLENFRREVVMRVKIDGLLHRQKSAVNKANAESVVNRIKVISLLDISEKRAPQDGRFILPVNQGGKLYEVPFRVSIIPGPHGEDVVLRVLDKSMAPIDLELLGFTSRDLDTFQRLIKNPQGMVLNSGPTGSGKTTTLYASLKHINNPAIKILSAEDPIEYDLEGVCQKQIGPKLEFAELARAFLRHDPDVLLIGEIRDAETADVAAKAAQTGHLVLSTVHTNDAVHAVPRLVSLGLDSEVIAAVLLGVLSQRLVRRICRNCAQPYLPDKKIREPFGKRAQGFEFVHGVGCHRCNQTGYRGRIGLFELFVVDNEIQHAIQDEMPVSEIERMAMEHGLAPLALDGLLKVEHKLTTLDELLRMIPYRQIVAHCQGE
jgi:type II secretory ATPase GspE/PulE/Tfp pilus assembly ATPase PilB-like protein